MIEKMIEIGIFLYTLFLAYNSVKLILHSKHKKERYYADSEEKVGEINKKLKQYQIIFSNIRNKIFLAAYMLVIVNAGVKILIALWFNNIYFRIFTVLGLIMDLEMIITGQSLEPTEVKRYFDIVRTIYNIINFIFCMLLIFGII